MDAHDQPRRTQPFRAKSFEPNSPPRVSTAPEPTVKRSHLHSLHHHRHRHHHHSHSQGHGSASGSGSSHSASRRAKETVQTVQSAIQLHPPISFGDLLKQASRAKEGSPSESRRHSEAKVNKDAEQDEVGLERVGPPKAVRPEDVKREQRREKLRVEELRTTLQKLSEQSLKSSRRLDDTYYSILEKISVLRQTIGSLQELTGLTKELHEKFQTATKDLVEEVQGHYEGIEDFQQQTEQLAALESRIEAGREKASSLNKRLSEAKAHVQYRAKLESEFEARSSRRLRVLWGSLGAILAVVLLAILVHHLKPIHGYKGRKTALNFGERDHLFDIPVPESVREVLGPDPSGTSPNVKLPSAMVEPERDDERLRVFDEL